MKNYLDRQAARLRRRRLRTLCHLVCVAAVQAALTLGAVFIGVSLQ